MLGLNDKDKNYFSWKEEKMKKQLFEFKLKENRYINGYIRQWCIDKTHHFFLHKDSIYADINDDGKFFRLYTENVQGNFYMVYIK